MTAFDSDLQMLVEPPRPLNLERLEFARYLAEHELIGEWPRPSTCTGRDNCPACLNEEAKARLSGTSLFGRE